MSFAGLQLLIYNQNLRVCFHKYLTVYSDVMFHHKHIHMYNMVCHLYNLLCFELVLYMGNLYMYQLMNFEDIDLVYIYHKLVNRNFLIHKSNPKDILYYYNLLNLLRSLSDMMSGYNNPLQ